MLFINPNNAKLVGARKTFQNEMQNFVFKRIDEISKIKGVNTLMISHFFQNNILDKIDNILIGDPHTLILINDEIKPFISLSPEIEKGIKYVFNYALFIKKSKKRYDAYNLADALDIRACPYCNRNYTNTVITKKKGKKIIRPQFDHYFDKVTSPLLAISFYNLIPSCSLCNSTIKGTFKMDIEKYLHPYIDNSIHDIRFTYKFKPKSLTGYKVVLDCPKGSKSRRSMKAFKIEKIYNSHLTELQELLKTKEYFSDRYLTILEKNLLKNVVTSKKELYRVVFGVEYDSEDFINRPFSKFKNDILKELGII